MSNKFHNKWHRHNHHTYPRSGEPDSGHDPIASESDPFKGDFVVQGMISASAPPSAYVGIFRGTLSATEIQTGLLSATSMELASLTSTEVVLTSASFTGVTTVAAASALGEFLTLTVNGSAVAIPLYAYEIL